MRREEESPREPTRLRRLLTRLAAARRGWQEVQPSRPPLLTEVQARERQLGGRPLLELARLPLEAGALEPLFAQVRDLHADSGCPVGEGSWPALLERYLAQELQRTDPLAAHLVFQTLRADWELWARPLARFLDPDLGRPATCPVCGGAPAMAIIDHLEGRRYLRCALCATRWTYRRLGCPACGNTEEAKLELLLAEDDPGWRLDLCDNCHRYLKTADLARIPDPELYALAAWGLEGVARRRGYDPLCEVG